MANNKAIWLSTFGVFLSGWLLYAAANYLYQSIVTGAIERQVAQFNVRRNVEQIEGLLDVTSLEVDSQFITAHDLITYAKLLQWKDYYMPQYDSSDEIDRLLTQSRLLRPSWSQTYLELYYQAKEKGDSSGSERYLSLATHYAPSSPTTALVTIDNVFSNWSRSSKETKIQASHQVILFATLWQYKVAFNDMIKYSKGRERICYLLEFNRLTPPACS